MGLFAVTSEVSLWPLAVLVMAIALVVVLIAIVRLHPFPTLILAALLVGLLAEQLPGAKARVPRPDSPVVSPDGRALRNHWVQAVELTGIEFGRSAGTIALALGLATLLGMCLLESGAADKIVRRFIAFFGERNAGVGLLLSTYVLSIPIFFDTMFMLMVPLARALRLRTGKDYLLYVMAICCGGVITHSMTVPHPGPLAVVDSLKLDVGVSLLAGILVGLVPLATGWFVCQWLNARLAVPLRETPGPTLTELRATVDKPESELPSLFWSLTPILLPIALISLASFMVIGKGNDAFVKFFGGKAQFDAAFTLFEFLGHRNVALLLGTLVALFVLARQRRYYITELCERMGPPLEAAGTILLVTAAGGAFGLMLRHAGVGEAIKAAAGGHHLNLLWLAYLVAVVLRVAQGSATVAMFATSAMLAPLLTGGGVPYDPIYIFLAIGFGSFAGSWMNDTGFWVVSKLGGLTEAETLKTWTVLLTVNSLVGVLATWLLSLLIPFPLGKPGP
ncbi:MAG: Gnt-II system L-idonate transporter [Verrucomicrobiota bacterium]|jgi:GntP family gluconate:H+ symporter